MAIQHAYVDLFLKNASHLPPSLHAHVTHFLGGSNLGTLCIVLGLWHESKSHKLFRIPGGGALRAGEVGSDRHPSLAKIA